MLPLARNRLESGIPFRFLTRMPIGRLQGLPSNTNGRRGQRDRGGGGRGKEVKGGNGKGKKGGGKGREREEGRNEGKEGGRETYQRRGNLPKHGIKLNPSKVKAISNLKPPRMLKEIQGLNEMLVALSQFLSKDADRSLPFFKALKSGADMKTIQWTANAKEAFQKMKEFIEILPTLIAPIKGKVLIMYLTTLVESISDVLLTEKEKRHVPIYFISRVLQGTELNYPELERLMLSLIYDARRLGRYEFETTNNEAKYEALLAGLRIAEEMEIKDLSIFIESQLASEYEQRMEWLFEVELTELEHWSSLELDDGETSAS
ncbi:reverse transcriptase domain-containing protein [Tanacetum coccineum]